MHDTLAWIMAWVVIIVVPIVFVILLWKLHEIPEKLAHNRNHSNVEAVKFMSWVGLFTGGLLFPLAFIYAVMRPFSIHVTSIGEDKTAKTPQPKAEPNDLSKELHELRLRLSQLELNRSGESPDSHAKN